MILGSIYLLITCSVLVGMAVLVLIGGETKYKKRYPGCQTSVFMWCASQVLQLLATDLAQLKVAYYIGNLGICFLGTLWLLFCVGYRFGRIPKWCIAVGGLASAFHFLAVVTNEWHHLYYANFAMNETTHNVLFFTNVGYTYICVFVGAILLYRAMGQEELAQDKQIEQINQHTPRNAATENEEDGQSEKKAYQSRLSAKILIVISVVLPTILNLCYLKGWIPVQFDVTPLGFGVSSILVLCATIHYRFLDVELLETTRQLAVSREKLSLAKERNEIAQQVHDTTGHTLTMIQSYLKMASFELEQYQQGEVEDVHFQDASQYLADARKLCSNGIKELREAINQMRKEESSELITQGVMQLAEQVKEIPVQVTIQGEDSEQYCDCYRVIYDTVRESITNCLKYANASKLEVLLRFKENAIELMVADDGDGCEELVDNNGLRGIRERVEKVGGTVRFITGKGEGFMTRVKLKIKQE